MGRRVEMKPVGLRDRSGGSSHVVRIEDGFWSPRQETNRTVTIPHQLRQLEETGRIDNLKASARAAGAEFKGYRFNDSDVYKWAEAAAYSLATHPDPELEAKLDDVIGIIGEDYRMVVLTKRIVAQKVPAAAAYLLADLNGF